MKNQLITSRLIKFPNHKHSDICVFFKIDSVHEILDTKVYDILFLNETKLDYTVPDSHLSHKKYTLYRRDRDFISGTGSGRHGGGLLLFIRKFLKNLLN